MGTLCDFHNAVQPLCSSGCELVSTLSATLVPRQPPYSTVLQPVILTTDNQNCSLHPDGPLPSSPWEPLLLIQAEHLVDSLATLKGQHSCR